MILSKLKFLKILFVLFLIGCDDPGKLAAEIEELERQGVEQLEISDKNHESLRMEKHLLQRAVDSLKIVDAKFEIMMEEMRLIMERNVVFTKQISVLTEQLRDCQK